MEKNSQYMGRTIKHVDIGKIKNFLSFLYKQIDNFVKISILEKI